ncbi:hypothetical protein MHOCP_07020 [Moorella humiferrea]|uniref:hypothetical protein n=1 Tax=Neomoorella humiferrea TaxID=676965 RepID=UPI0030D6207B
MKELLKEILYELPSVMREEIEGYIQSIESNAPSIFEEIEVKHPSEDLVEQLIFYAGIRRIWTLLSTVYWTIDNSLVLMRNYDVTSIRVGTTIYGKKTEYYLRLRQLFQDFNTLLSQLGLKEIVDASNLIEIATLIVR